MTLSVLMSVYYKERPGYLDRALQSLADQTLPADEVILVEDGPIGEGLQAIIERYRSALRIRSPRLETNSGLAAALNEGLRHCAHTLVARMDTDDVCAPQRFERQVGYFSNHRYVDVLGTFAVAIDEKERQGALLSRPVTHGQIMSLLWTCPFIHPSVMFTRDRLVAAGGYDGRLRRRQDYELWFRLAKQGFRFRNMPETLLLHRVSIETPVKQSARQAWQQAMIGYRGSSMLGMTWWKRGACFLPFFRALLPAKIQHAAYIAARKFDPRLSSGRKASSSCRQW